MRTIFDLIGYKKNANLSLKNHSKIEMQKGPN